MDLENGSCKAWLQTPLAPPCPAPTGAPLVPVAPDVPPAPPEAEPPPDACVPAAPPVAGAPPLPEVPPDIDEPPVPPGADELPPACGVPPDAPPPVRAEVPPPLPDATPPDPETPPVPFASPPPPEFDEQPPCASAAKPTSSTPAANRLPKHRYTLPGSRVIGPMRSTLPPVADFRPYLAETPSSSSTVEVEGSISFNAHKELSGRGQRRRFHKRPTSAVLSGARRGEGLD